MERNRKIEYPSYTRKEIIALYEVSDKVFRSWLKAAKIYEKLKNKRVFTPAETQLIFSKLENPCE